MLADARARLADRQAALVAALAGCQAAPPGFDSERLHVSAIALAAKRRAAVARAWPELTQGLKAQFGEAFAEYAEKNPLPAHGGPLADGRAFARCLAAAGILPEQARLAVLAVDLRYATVSDGLLPRRWPSIRITVLTHPRRLTVALRLPWIGEHWLTMMLGR